MPPSPVTRPVMVAACCAAPATGSIAMSASAVNVRRMTRCMHPPPVCQVAGRHSIRWSPALGNTMALHRSSGFDPKNLLSDHVNERDTASRVCVVSDSHGIYNMNSYIPPFVTACLDTTPPPPRPEPMNDTSLHLARGAGPGGIGPAN